jgi:Ca-activated chloride channel family protein
MRFQPLVLLGVLLAAGVSVAAQTFRTGIELVHFGVTVTDRRGQIVTGLGPEDFRVVEDGRPQTVVQFVPPLAGDDAPAPGDPARGPLHVGLLLDTSGSMETDLALSHTAAIKFLNLLPTADDITIVDFDTEVRAARYGQRDFARLVERIRGRKPDGFTALYDALGVYLDGADEQDGRTILVVYTDGGDTRSALGYGDLLTMLKASDVTVYAVGFIGHQGGAAHLNRRRLMQIAEQTGGQAFFPGGIKDLDAAYARVLADIHGQYHLGYASTSTRDDGAWRKVELTVTRPGLSVRARKGYFARYRPAPGSG